MNIDKCPYCDCLMNKGKLGYRYVWKASKIIFEDGSEKIVKNFNPFSGFVMDKVFYCDKCEIVLSHIETEKNK